MNDMPKPSRKVKVKFRSPKKSMLYAEQAQYHRLQAEEDVTGINYPAKKYLDFALGSGPVQFRVS